MSLKQAIDRGVRVRVIVDHRKYEALPSEQVMGSISLSPDSPTYNREVGLILDDTHFVRTLRDRFEMDFKSKRHAY